MKPEQKAAFVFARSAAMLVELEAMKAANAERAANGYAQAYDEKAIFALVDEYGLGHNAVMGLLSP